MSDWGLEMAARFEGFNDQQIAQIEAAIPVASAVVDLLVKNKPLLDQVMKDWAVLGPVLSMVLKQVQEKNK